MTTTEKLEDLATTLCISDRTLYGYMNKGMRDAVLVTVDGKTAYDIRAAVQWCRAEVWEKRPAMLERKQKAEAELKEEQARQLARENDFAEGDLISQSDNQRELSVLCTTIRDHFLGAPERICASVSSGIRDFTREELSRLIESDLVLLDDTLAAMGA